jgi:hypothetical protein
MRLLLFLLLLLLHVLDVDQHGVAGGVIGVTLAGGAGEIVVIVVEVLISITEVVAGGEGVFGLQLLEVLDRSSDLESQAESALPDLDFGQRDLVVLLNGDWAATIDVSLSGWGIVEEFEVGAGDDVALEVVEDALQHDGALIRGDQARDVLEVLVPALVLVGQEDVELALKVLLRGGLLLLLVGIVVDGLLLDGFLLEGFLLVVGEGLGVHEVAGAAAAAEVGALESFVHHDLVDLVEVEVAGQS